MSRWSWRRLLAVARKELIQLRRDRLTFGMMIGVPLIQLTLFGFAINTDPKDLPTVVWSAEQTVETRAMISGLRASGYFRVLQTPQTLNQAEAMLEAGDIQFLLEIPSGFTASLLRGERPTLLLAADATDPVATGSALSAAAEAMSRPLRQFGPAPMEPAAMFDLRVHRRYNPEGSSQFNVVPALIGVILTMTMIMMTSLAVTREVERGTMENLLSTPVTPLEALVGKIAPYIGIGGVQVMIILVCAHAVFGVPVEGTALALIVGVMVFIVANLSVGITFSSVARNQTQAIQLSFFFFLPSILLSGFMFPFRGMPSWAQVVGEILPLTHFVRLIRGVMLKGYDLHAIWPHLWPLLVFTFAMLTLGAKRFRRTLD